MDYAMHDFFVRFPYAAGTLEDITDWLNSLVGSSSSQGTIVRIVDWHFVHGQRYNEFAALARVEVRKDR